MEGSAYEIAVYVLRYWFAALMVFLLFRLVRSVVRGWNEQRTRERAASSKYTVGLLEVVAPELDARGKVSPCTAGVTPAPENRIGSAARLTGGSVRRVWPRCTPPFTKRETAFCFRTAAQRPACC